jgi:hypothetical protein
VRADWKAGVFCQTSSRVLVLLSNFRTSASQKAQLPMDHVTNPSSHAFCARIVTFCFLHVGSVLSSLCFHGLIFETCNLKEYRRQYSFGANCINLDDPTHTLGFDLDPFCDFALMFSVCVQNQHGILWCAHYTKLFGRSHQLWRAHRSPRWP